MGLLIKSPSQVASGLPFSYLSSEQRGARIGRAAGAQTQRPQRRPDLRAEGRLVRLAASRDGGRGPVHLGRCRGDLAAAAADLSRGPRCRPSRPRRRRRRPRWRCRRRPTPLGRGPELILPWSPPPLALDPRRRRRSLLGGVSGDRVGLGPTCKCLPYLPYQPDPDGSAASPTPSPPYRPRCPPPSGPGILAGGARCRCRPTSD